MAMTCVYSGECVGCMRCLERSVRGDIYFEASRRGNALVHTPERAQVREAGSRKCVGRAARNYGGDI